MAGKKPAKPMAGQAKSAKVDVSIYGVQVRFVGGKDSSSDCEQCGRKTIRGMIRLKDNGKEFCSNGCAFADYKQSLPPEETNEVQ